MRMIVPKGLHLAGVERSSLHLLAAASHMADSADESDQDAHPP